MSEQDVKQISEELGNVEEEVQGKDRLLEIENALDEVRTVAMNMKKPEDMLDICRVICRVLEKLNVRDIRNIQTAIFYETKHIHTNYVYFRLADVSLLQDVDYSLQEDVAAFADKMLRGPSEFFTTSFDKAKINEYIKYQDEAGQFVDQYLENAESLNFYFYSFGTGALGLSTYSPLSEDDIVLFKRFRNVFELAYRRFADIEQAIEQAREAQIEVALERVRAKAMAMHKSEDLRPAIDTLFIELDKLDLGMIRCGIGIINKEKRTADVWTTSQTKEGCAVHASGDESLDIHPLLQGAYDAWIDQSDFSYFLKGDDLALYYNEIEKTNFKLPDAAQMSEHSNELCQYYYVTAFRAGNLFAFRDSEFTDEAKSVMKRFAGVFNMTYQRFLDIQRAEEQAHKSQIEAALERVRARALAMQEPEELKEVERVLRHEMGLLGVREIETCGIFIRADNTSKAECWYELSNPKDEEKRISDHFELDFNDTTTGSEILRFLNSPEEHVSIDLSGKERKEWIEYFRSNSPSFKGYYGDEIPDIIYHLQKFPHGALCVASFSAISEESRELLMRAANVFSLAYSRFKDLTKSRQDLQNLIEEKKRSESLLLNILPEEIALELKQFSRSYARYHDEVTILFADIKGFSGITEVLSAEELVLQLDECFRAFDKIVDKHGLEKIKTVGDMYVCACGLPKPVNDNAVKTVRAALDMINFLKGFNAAKQIQDLPAFDFRVGIHTGPVITGVVGLKKFTYDIWGDSVTMAARMEQHGKPGKINISGSTFEQVKDKFTCTHRGKIEAKNKGMVDMYFVEG